MMAIPGPWSSGWELSENPPGTTEVMGMAMTMYISIALTCSWAKPRSFCRLDQLPRLQSTHWGFWWGSAPSHASSSP